MNSASGLESAKFWLEKLAELPEPSQPFRILNVCGGHERSIAQAGLRSLLPDWLELVPGPGCPVCVCAQDDLQAAIRLARDGKVLIAYGDMLRVPTTQRDTLLNAKADGATVLPVASPSQALTLAEQYPEQPVVFFAAGFETSFAPLAAVISQMRQPENLFYLCAGKLTWPAVDTLLQGEYPRRLHGLIAPGHVAAIMGAVQWQFCPQVYHLPTAVCGFTPDSLLEGIGWILSTGKAEVHNAYPQVVSPEGNLKAQALLSLVFDVTAGNWRGLGNIDQSTYALKADYRAHDARTQWPEVFNSTDRTDAMPKGCRCADVVTAKALPSECSLFRNGCDPSTPQGPCMVSDEGACQIWYRQRQR